MTAQDSTVRVSPLGTANAIKEKITSSVKKKVFKKIQLFFSPFKNVS